MSDGSSYTMTTTRGGGINFSEIGTVQKLKSPICTTLSFPPSSILPTRHHSSSSRSSDPACIALSSRNHIRYSQHHLDIHRTHGPVLTIAVEQTKIVITSHSLSSIKQSPALPSLRPFKSVFDNQSWPCNSTCLSFSAIGPAC